MARRLEVQSALLRSAKFSSLSALVRVASAAALNSVVRASYTLQDASERLEHYHVCLRHAPL